MTELSRMPPFKSLEAFVVAARVLSFTETASALHITVPAVSRRIQSLERELGVALFQRRHNALVLTQAGESYRAHLEPALASIRRASDCIRVDGSRSRSVKIGIPASLAANWLVPRLHHFHLRHRGVHVELASLCEHGEVENECPALHEGDADLVVRLGSSRLAGLSAARLFDLEGFPVCSPALLDRDADLRSADALSRLPLLGIKGQPDLWQDWFRRAGMCASVGVAQEFDDLHLLYRAAACGLGVAFGVDVLVQPYLEQGQLVRPFDARYRLNKSYYVVCRSADLTRRPVSTFRDWLLARAAEDRARRDGAWRNGGLRSGLVKPNGGDEAAWVPPQAVQT